MNTIITILGCLFLGFIITIIIYFFINYNNLKIEKDFNKIIIISTIVIATILFIFNSGYTSQINKLENFINTSNSINELRNKIDEL